MRQRLILFTLLLIVTAVEVAFAQVKFVRHVTNNDARIEDSFNKTYIILDYDPDEHHTEYLGGFLFSARFVRTTTSTGDFVKLSIGEFPLLSVSIENNQFVIKRQVMWRECLNLGPTGCSLWSDPEYGEAKYYSWDNLFVGNSGWFSVLLSDNGIQIRVSNVDEGGPYVCDLSYWGSHLSGIEQRISTQTSLQNIKMEIPSSVTSQISLTNIDISAGPVVAAVTVFTERDPAGPMAERSPQTAYPAGTGSGARESGPQVGEIVLASGDPADGQVAMFPNPVAKNLFLRTSFPAETKTQLILYDLHGRPLFADDRLLPAGEVETEFAIDRARMARGIIVYELKYGNTVKRGKLLIE